MIYIAVQLIQIFSAGPQVTGNGGTRGPRGPKKNIARGTTDPEYSRPEYKTDVIFFSIFVSYRSFL